MVAIRHIRNDFVHEISCALANFATFLPTQSPFVRAHQRTQEIVCAIPF